MSTDQAVTETVSDLDDIVFETDAMEYGEIVVGIVEPSTEKTVKAAFGAIAGKTAEVATEETVEVAVEAIAEEAVKTVAEEPAEDVVEAIPEVMIEPITEDIVETDVEVAVEDSAETPAEQAENADEDTPKKAGFLGLLKSPIGLGGVAVLVLAIGAGGFFFLTSGGDPKADEALEMAEAEHGAGDTKVDDAEKAETHVAANAGEAWDNTFENEYGTLTFSGADAIYHTAPATVSLDVGADARRLRVSVGILTDKETAKALYSDGLKVSLLQIEAVESVDFGPYREWEMPGLIVSAFKTKLENAYPETKIRAVIIRDFQRVGA